MGICMPLKPDDQITSTHRGHGHCIAKGAKVDRMFAEFFGKTTGYCKGRGGSMHIADVSAGNLGANGIVAGGIPIAVGAALSAKMQKNGKVVICFFGDGANNEGAFHESLNMASIWKLPVVFVCENNGYAAAQSYAEHTPVESLAARADAYGMPGECVDGNDAPSVLEATRRARERALAGDGPTLIECMTYRWRGHGETDPQHYQPAEEIAAWKARCPIARLSGSLRTSGELSDAELEDLRASAAAIVTEAVRFAEESPWPEPEEALDDVWAE